MEYFVCVKKKNLFAVMEIVSFSALYLTALNLFQRDSKRTKKGNSEIRKMEMKNSFLHCLEYIQLPKRMLFELNMNSVGPLFDMNIKDFIWPYETVMWQ